MTHGSLFSGIGACELAAEKNGIVSENQAKKMLGNGWTVDVITHIFSKLC